MITKRNLIFIFLTLIVIVGCEAISHLPPELTSEFFQKAGLDVRPEDVRQFVSAWEDSNRPPLTESEEYYLGRAVASQLLSRYRYLNDKEKNIYISKVGLVLTIHSNRPEIYKGYHFGILDTPEKNAFGCPGGYIFVTKGAIDLISTDVELREAGEDALAGILAHEIAHIALKHPTQSVSDANKKRFYNTFGRIFTRVVSRTYSDTDIADLSDILGNWAVDIFTTIAERGYSRALEYEADTYAVKFLIEAGYEPEPFISLLKKITKDTRGGLLSTHPHVNDRIENIRRTIMKYSSKGVYPSRTARFRNVFKR